MCARVGIVYNEPVYSRYSDRGEETAVLGVLQAVEAVHEGLLELGHSVLRVPLVPPVEQVRKQLSELEVDLVFNLFEGFCGYPETEADIPEILSGLGVLYTGCDGRALRLALDKVKAKIVLKSGGVATPDFQFLTPETVESFRLSYPCIVKPRGEDASHGLSAKSVVFDFNSLREQVITISSFYGGQALVEEFIDGREFNATVLGNSENYVLPPSEIDYSLPPGMPKVLTFAAKWEPSSPDFQGTRVICPAQVDAEMAQKISSVALKAFSLVGCRGYARVDMRMDSKGRLHVIEVNPNPDISPDNGAVRQAKAAGMSYSQFVDKLVRLALEKECDDCQNLADAEKRQTRLDEDIAEYTRIQAVRGGGSRGVS